MSRNGKLSSSKPKLSRRVYFEECKQDAMRLVAQAGDSLTEAARSPGVHVSQIRKWREKFMPQDKESPSLTEDKKRNWTEVLGRERLTGATFDRLTYRCHILETAGESYWLQDAKSRHTKTSSSKSNETK